MKFALADPADGYAVSAYDATGVVVDGRRFESSMILMPRQIIESWPPAGFGELNEGHFLELAGLGTDLVLLGTGERQRFPAASLYRPLIERRIGLEVMTTAAACRTYNILMAEGRSVAAALLLG